MLQIIPPADKPQHLFLSLDVEKSAFSLDQKSAGKIWSKIAQTHAGSSSYPESYLRSLVSGDKTLGTRLMQAMFEREAASGEPYSQQQILHGQHKPSKEDNDIQLFQ